MKMKLRSIAILLLLSTTTFAKDKDEAEPTYKIVEEHVLESPISSKEMDNWEMYGSCVMTKNNIILSPEIKNAKGAIINKPLVSTFHDWIVDIKMTIGNEA
jgi:hypothetical protein